MVTFKSKRAGFG